MISAKWKSRLYGIGALTFTILGIGLLYTTLIGGPTQPQSPEARSESTSRSPTRHPLHGKTAPDFTLEQMNGETFQLSEHRGDIVVVNFWATWCPPCRKEIPGFITLQNKLGEKGVTFVGVSLDEKGFDVVRPYAEKMGINYPLVVGGDSLTRKYGGVRALPTTFVVGPAGTIQYARPGFLPETVLRKQLQPLLARVEGSS